MFVTTAKRKSPKGAITVVRLVHGYREAGKSKMKIIKTIGQSRDLEEIEYFRKIGKNLIEELKTGIRPKLCSSTSKCEFICAQR